MMAHNEVYLRCAGQRQQGNLGDDILSKITLKSGVGTFRLTDLDGNIVRLRGSSLSFVLYLDQV